MRTMLLNLKRLFIIRSLSKNKIWEEKLLKNSVLCYLEETASRIPDKVAFFDMENEITFNQLRDRAIDTAFAIRSSVSGRRNPILTYLPKSVENIVAFMGILYSGNFYTPTDIRFPEEKVKSIIATLKPAAIIVDTDTKEKLSTFAGIDDICLINMDDISPSGRYNEGRELVSAILDVDPVYTFFTSGSTGTPKGVIINNHNVIDYTDWAVKTFNINEDTVMGNQSPFYFDISTQDIYSTLKSGAALGIIPPVYFAFPAKALQFINERKINFLYWVPSAFVNIANYGLLKSIPLENVELIMFGGEVMPVKQLNHWKRYLPRLKTIANVYGPTEATVNCTYYIVDREFTDSEVLPLGKACENTGLLVLDDENNIIDSSHVNQLGELCVYGSSLSAGYWDDTEKTDEKYIDNPINKFYREKMYLTGDLVYYNDLGELVFAGRKDFQIKHSGYRIELGEIESAAMGKKEISGVCAAYHYDKKQIVLFYQGNVGEEEVKDYLLTIIPKYMVPTIYYPLKAFPYNDNGKIDRKQLEKQYLQ